MVGITSTPNTLIFDSFSRTVLFLSVHRDPLVCDGCTDPGSHPGHFTPSAPGRYSASVISLPDFGHFTMSNDNDDGLGMMKNQKHVGKPSLQRFERPTACSESTLANHRPDPRHRNDAVSFRSPGGPGPRGGFTRGRCPPGTRPGETAPGGGRRANDIARPACYPGVTPAGGTGQATPPGAGRRARILARG